MVTTLIPWLLSLMWLLPQAQLAQQSPAIPRAQVTSPHGNLNIACENCHTFTSWRPLRAVPEFNHDKTKYPLRGMHINVTCMQCHTSLVFSNVGTRCADCHADLHRGQFGAKCEQCHTIRGWRVSLGKIEQHQNRFPLVGAHASVECDACHKSAAVGQFQGLSTNCYSCHQTQYKNAVPDHIAMGFPPTCESCHSSLDTWLGAKFDHAKFTGFALTGMHATLSCTSCHIGGKFKGTPASCYACHAKDYNGATNPNHVQAGFPRECATCHSTSSWAGATFDHNRFTKFPLTGLHQTTPCVSCHINGKFAGTPTDCASCHITAYNGTTNPNHKALGFPTDCSICHSTTGWIPASFDHSKTKFPLTGKHVALSCVSCHANGNFTNLQTTCVSCHLKDYNGTTYSKPCSGRIFLPIARCVTQRMVGNRRASITTKLRFRLPERTSTSPAPSVTSTGGIKALRPTATPATGRTTPARRIPVTLRRISPRRVTLATTPRPGWAPCSRTPGFPSTAVPTRASG